MKPLYIFLFVPFFWACSDLKKGKQLEQVAVLNDKLDSLQSQWNREEKGIIDSFIITCTSKIDSVSLLYQSQEIDLHTATQLDLFKQANGDFVELKKIHSFFPTVLQDKKQAIESLQHDIGNGSGRREKYDQYIEFEQQELQMLMQQLDHYTQTKQRCQKNYVSSKATVDTLLWQLATHRKE